MSGRCKTINLAHISVDNLRKNAKKLQHIPRAVQRSSYEQCHFPEYIPPPPREIRSAKIQVCRPRHMDFVSPPVPCICPPCPICPSRSQQMKDILRLLFKVGIFYFLFEVARKKNIWGPPDGTSQIVTNASNFVMRLASRDPKANNVFGGDRLGIIEPDRIRYKLFTLWDKAIVFVFTWTVGVPLQLAHDTFETIETALIGDDDPPKKAEAERNDNATKPDSDLGSGKMDMTNSGDTSTSSQPSPSVKNK